MHFPNQVGSQQEITLLEVSSSKTVKIFPTNSTFNFLHRVNIDNSPQFPPGRITTLVGKGGYWVTFYGLFVKDDEFRRRRRHRRRRDDNNNNNIKGEDDNGHQSNNICRSVCPRRRGRRRHWKFQIVRIRLKISTEANFGM